MLKKICRLFKNLHLLTKVDLKHNPAIMLDVDDYIENILYYIPTANVPRPLVYTPEQTAKILLESDMSLARFGDGEIELIRGNDIPYQKYDKKLAKRLKEILENKQKDLLVGINYSYYYPVFRPSSTKVQRIFQASSYSIYREKFKEYIDYNKQYCDAAISSLKTERNDEYNQFYENLRKIWFDKNIIVVCCKSANDKIEHDIFDNVKNRINIFVPSKNSWDVYDEVLFQIRKEHRDKLIILLCGPMGKVIASDLCAQGQRALDLGHLGKSYDVYNSQVDVSSEVAKSFYSPD